MSVPAGTSGCCVDARPRRANLDRGVARSGVEVGAGPACPGGATSQVSRLARPVAWTTPPGSATHERSGSSDLIPLGPQRSITPQLTRSDLSVHEPFDSQADFEFKAKMR